VFEEKGLFAHEAAAEGTRRGNLVCMARRPTARLRALLKPNPADSMKLRPVGTDVGNWHKDGPHFVELLETLTLT
jgi:hypothetical protein